MFGERTRVSKICGLYGMAGRGITKDDLSVYYQLGIVNMLRGTDSTGYFEANSYAKDQEKSSKLLKHAESFDYTHWYYTRSKEGTSKGKMLDTIAADVFIGHNRYSTVGAINEENAQPFACKDLVVAHNGTLKDKKYLNDPQNRSDTYLLVQDLAERGFAPVLQELHKDSAYALTMYDKKSRKLFFARNMLRGLSFAVNQKRGVMYWSSEYMALKYVLDRNGIDYDIMENGKVKGRAIYSFKDGILFEVDIMNIRPYKEILKPVLQIYEEPKKIETTSAVTTLPVTTSSNNNKPKTEEKKSDLPVKNGKDLFKNCVCCDKLLTVVEQYDIRNDRYGYYDKDNNTYYCSCIDMQTSKAN